MINDIHNKYKLQYSKEECCIKDSQWSRNWGVTQKRRISSCCRWNITFKLIAEQNFRMSFSLFSFPNLIQFDSVTQWGQAFFCQNKFDNGRLRERSRELDNSVKDTEQLNIRCGYDGTIEKNKNVAAGEKIRNISWNSKKLPRLTQLWLGYELFY